MSSPAMGTVVHYHPTDQDRADVGYTDPDPWLAFIQYMYDDGDACIYIVARKDIPDGNIWAASCRCNEGTGDGEWEVPA